MGQMLLWSKQVLSLQRSSKRPWEEGDHRYHNPDPLYCLIESANETKSLIEGVRLGTLIDSGAQCSSITYGMVKKLGLELKSLKNVCLSGWGGQSWVSGVTLNVR